VFVVLLHTHAGMMNGNNHHTNTGINLDGERMHVLIEPCETALTGSSATLPIDRDADS